MYKIMLVDDEELVIKSLKASVEWEQYGFEVAGYALNGEDALTLLEEIKPDLIFTDIRMPGISGLELIKMTKKLKPELLTIIVSGHAEFALAQKAIQYGVMGYCLKPFDEAEIISYLIKAKKLLDHPKRYSENNLLDLIEENSKTSHEQLCEALQRSGISIGPSHKIYALISLGKEILEKLVRVTSGLMLKIGYNKYAYFVAQEALDELLPLFNLTTEQDILSIGVSESIEQISQIKKAIQQAEINAYRYFTMGLRHVFRSNDYQMETEFSVQDLQKAFNQQDMPSVFTIMDAIQAQFMNGLFTIRHAMMVYNDTMSFLGNLEESIYSFGELTERFDNVQDMLLSLKELIVKNTIHVSDQNTPKIKNPTFMSIFHHVNEKFYHNISLQSISSEFNVNANYVSQLFKKEAGLTFTEYVTKLRMDYACTLLKTSDLSIQEIAEKVGMTDYFYFSRIFKRTTGYAPSVYRQEHHNLENS
jgi:two-component system response regulator YesN